METENKLQVMAATKAAARLEKFKEVLNQGENLADLHELQLLPLVTE